MEQKHINQHSYIYRSTFNRYIIIHQWKYNCKHKSGKSTYLIENLFRNQLCRCNVPPNRRPACSLISQQRFHPWDGHDSPRNKELTGLHITKDNNTTRVHSSSKTTQLGLSSEQQIIQANKVGFIRPSRSWERINAKPPAMSCNQTTAWAI